MTPKNTILSLILLMFFLTFSPHATQVSAATSGKFNMEGTASMAASSEPAPKGSSSQNMEFPDSGLKSTHAKLHLLKIEELGKIHRFHKERVKKSKRHPNKLWIIAKLVIISCQIALLIHAFMHLTH